MLAPKLPVFKDGLVSLATEELNLGTKFLLAGIRHPNHFNLLIYATDAVSHSPRDGILPDRKVE
jgi:hypothetical protein